MSVIGDLYNIEERLAELDESLSLTFDYDKEMYEVRQNGHYILDWPRPLDERLLQHMRAIDIRRKDYDPLAEVIAHNERLDREAEKKRHETLETAVKEKQKFLTDEIDGIKMRHVF